MSENDGHPGGSKDSTVSGNKVLKTTDDNEEQKKKSKREPQSQNLTAIAEEFKAGTRRLKEASALASKQTEAQKQQGKTQWVLSEQLSNVTQQMTEIKNKGSSYLLFG